MDRMFDLPSKVPTKCIVDIVEHHTSTCRNNGIGPKILNPNWLSNIRIIVVIILGWRPSLKPLGKILNIPGAYPE